MFNVLKEYEWMVTFFDGTKIPTNGENKISAMTNARNKRSYLSNYRADLRISNVEKISKK